MSVALGHQEAGTSKTRQRNVFSAEGSSSSTLTSKESASINMQAKPSQYKGVPQSQEAEGSPVLAPESYVESYTIGWVCALQEEFQTAKQMLDEKNLPTPRGMERSANDNNTYLYGKIGEHLVVIGCLPRGRMGLVSAASVATHMLRSFPSLKFALLVGIGGGAPTRKNDIRLGDVVVSTPCETHGGVVQLDFGLKLSDGIFRRRGHLNGVPDALLSATGTLGGYFEDPTEPDKIAQHMARMDRIPGYQRPNRDQLYVSSYEHQVSEADGSEDDGDWTNETAEDSCRHCDKTKLVRRSARNNSDRIIKVHYGTIASADHLMKDARLRDSHARDQDLRVLCFEMEAAGLMNSLPCIVIRGISDYADSHKNDDWKRYGALTSAAYARELLLVMEVQSVVTLPSWAVATEQRMSS
jgi:nucleoside phosphorylase